LRETDFPRIILVLFHLPLDVPDHRCGPSGSLCNFKQRVASLRPVPANAVMRQIGPSAIAAHELAIVDRLAFPVGHSGSTPRKVPDGLIWHNHIMHTVGMGHGMNGFPLSVWKSSGAITALRLRDNAELPARKRAPFKQRLRHSLDQGQIKIYQIIRLFA
jgi:hypothetical protein